MELKLNVKRTFFIGLAFFSILMLWRVHLVYTPLLTRRLLQNHFGPGDYLEVVGIIMAIDNLLAILLLPLFGMWSDRTKNKMGKRTIFIVIGGTLSVILFPLIAVMYLMNSFWWFLVMVVLMKFAMNIWRGPAVALMPDITPKPLRAKANAIINFMGYMGAILASVLLMIPLFGFNLGNPETQSLATVPFFITAAVMAVLLIILLTRFKENKVLAEMRPALERGEELSETIERIEENKPLSKRDKLNLIIVMTAVFMAWFAFDAMDTFGSTFEQDVLLADGETGKWAILGAILSVGALVAFLPSIKLTKKIGRKNSVLLGLGIVVLSLIIAQFMPNVWALTPLFAISGAGWALVNISAFPIVVEMASAKNIGKLTGIYYIATQSAQALTAITAGFVFGAIGIKFYWLYAIVFMSLAFILCLFFKPRKVTEPVAAEPVVSKT